MVTDTCLVIAVLGPIRRGSFLNMYVSCRRYFPTWIVSLRCDVFECCPPEYCCDTRRHVEKEENT